MEAKKIKVIKDWLELKSIRNIQVFLGFANFYWQFIQGFNKIAAPLTLMLKTTRSPNEPASSRNNGSRSASGRNNNSKPVSRKNDSNSEVDRFGVSGNGMKYAKKSGKLFKSENLFKLEQLKSEKLFKSWKLAKLGKKSLKSGNLSNFDAKKNKSSFLTSDARMTFNHLWLVFTKTLILWHFDLGCYIWSETNASSYAISGILS